MKRGRLKMIHALEFECQAPLRFFEHCSACPRFGESCDDLIFGKEILRGRKRIVYNTDDHDDASVHAGFFKCYSPLFYFEKTRNACPHKGRCREEGLLLALLSGKAELTYTQKTPIDLPKPKRRPETTEIKPFDAKVYYVK